MKKILIALMLLGAICANSFAQEYDIVETGDEVRTFDNEVYLTVGTPSLVGLFAGMFGAIAQGIADSVNGQEGQLLAERVKPVCGLLQDTFIKLQPG